jgi:hypothetical protein
VLTIDQLSLPTAGGGVEFVQRDVSVGIIDIDPSIAGVLGFNFLNKRIDLDFRNAAATSLGEMLLTVTPEFDVVTVPEPAGAAGVATAVAVMMSRRRSRR